MVKKNTLAIRDEFFRLIEVLPTRKDRDLANEIKEFNDTFKGQDFFHQDLFEGILLFFASNLKKKMKIYVNDIIEDYNNSESNQKKIDEFLSQIAKKYCPDKTFLDRILNLMGIL